ncbi:MAG: adenylyl-sulfate kinase [Betaproteobacteria bacterium]|nr:adenylyl-sulfate kinase [Betaproteobacteria bacterium]
MTVQATRRAGPLGSAASKSSRDGWQRADDQGQPAGGAHEERFAAALPELNSLAPPSKSRHEGVEGRVRAPWGRKGAFENTILRARRGELKQFTGIDSAYEPPERSEVTLDCGDLTAAQALSTLLSRLRL